ncbi:MAG: DUF167 domain-containing protein [Candidatus Omnitrophota bacterium]
MAATRISVKVKPGSRQEEIEKLTEVSFLIRVKAAAHEGKANTAAIKLLSEYFDIPKSRIIIVRGEKSRDKVIDITD